jgi:hypothetical protein
LRKFDTDTCAYPLVAKKALTLLIVRRPPDGS